MRQQYQRASRRKKGELLDHAEEMTGLHRKSLIRRLNTPGGRKKRSRQRGRTYGVAMHVALKVIGESVDYICAERLQPNLVWLAQHLASHGELEVSPELLAQLERISISTVRRIMKRLGQDQPRLPQPRPAAAKGVAKQVPIGCIEWDQEEPGHFEVDLVHHSGPTTEGHYVHTLQMIDVATGWSERVAVLGRSYRVVEDGFRRSLIRLPFPIQHIHTDNGSEFLNPHILRFWQNAADPIGLSRGRPHHKNDQRFVEQKNDTLVRAQLGFERFDTVAHTRLMNLLYNKTWLFYNFFQPVMRLAEKQIVMAEDGRPRVRRRYDRARTPFDRLCQTGILSPSRRQQLEALRQRTNPRQLRQEIQDLIEQILALPGAVTGETEDIFKTLLTGEEEKRLRWAAGYVDKSPTGSDLPTYPQPLRRRAGPNGKERHTHPSSLKEPR